MNQPISVVRAELAQAREDLAAERTARNSAVLALSAMTEHFRAARRAKLERSEPWPDPLDPDAATRPVDGI